MKSASKEEIAAVWLFFVSLFLAIGAGLTAVWLTAEVRVFGIVLLPTVAVAAMMILYYDWRTKLSRRFRAGAETPHEEVGSASIDDTSRTARLNAQTETSVD